MHILFYDDVSDFGGHEVMTLYAVEQLLRRGDVQVTFLHFAGNARLRDGLEALDAPKARFQRIEIPHVTRSLQGLRTPFQTQAIAAVAAQMRSLRPDAAVIVQGYIEMSLIGLLAAKSAGLFTVSYIPYAHRLTEIGTRLGALRERADARYYRTPDLFITPSESSKQDLRARGATAPVAVVYNAVDARRYHEVARADARRGFGLAEGETTLAIIGRVYFGQKGHDLLQQALKEAGINMGQYRLLVVGDGPDSAHLKELTEACGLTPRVRFVPWSGDLSAVYAAADMLVLPSRYEGLPLVMLEAMYFGLPVVASNRDGMRELLPPDWLFPTGDAHALRETLHRVLQSDTRALTEANRERVRREFTLEAFGENFYQALCAYKK